MIWARRQPWAGFTDCCYWDFTVVIPLGWVSAQGRREEEEEEEEKTRSLSRIIAQRLHM